MIFLRVFVLLFAFSIFCYGIRHDLDFDKYEALRLAEQLPAIARASNHEKASFYDLEASSLRERLSVQNGHFKAYFLALLAGKEFASVLESLSKIDKSFDRQDSATSRQRRCKYARPPSSPRSASRVVCSYCDTPGHRVSQCWRKQRDLGASMFPQSEGSKSAADINKGRYLLYLLLFSYLTAYKVFGNKVFGIICPLFLFLFFVLFFSPPLFVPCLFPFSPRPVEDSLEGSLIPYSDYRGQGCHLPGFSDLFLSLFFLFPLVSFAPFYPEEVYISSMGDIRKF